MLGARSYGEAEYWFSAVSTNSQFMIIVKKKLRSEKPICAFVSRPM